MEKAKSHFVLVHGACHGAWCWYKLATLLRSAGHHVSTPDMAAAGIDNRQVEELKSISEHAQPLMDIMKDLPSGEKVILVGHSFGGALVSLAMERFPDKISVAVFVTAFMPGPHLMLTTILHQYYSRLESPLDNQFFFNNGADNPPTSFVLGEEFLGSLLYQRCPPEDLTLAKMLIRPLFLLSDENIKEDVILSEEKYGTVPTIYVICDEDKIIKRDFQVWMIEKNVVKKVMEIEGVDHMVMLSKPQHLSDYLQNISEIYR